MGHVGSAPHPVIVTCVVHLTPSAFTDNWEFGVVTNRPDAIQAAVAIFVADWTI